MEYNLDTSIREAVLSEEVKKLKRELEYLKREKGYYDNSYLNYSTLQEPEIIDVNNSMSNITLSKVADTKVEQSDRYNGHHVIGKTQFINSDNLQYSYYIDHSRINYSGSYAQADILLMLHKKLIMTLLQAINDKK